MAVAAVIFDMDGVLLDSEQIWDQVRRDLAASHGVPWPAEATSAMMGMSTPEWAQYLVADVGLPLSQEDAAAAVVDGVLAAYAAGPPLLDGAERCVSTLAAEWPLGLASSSARPIIDAVLAATPLGDYFGAVVSSEETAGGKPAPDVYLAAARGLGVAPGECVAVEDSSNGMRAAAAAGMALIAAPNAHFPPDADALALASVVVRGPAEISPATVRAAYER